MTTKKKPAVKKKKKAPVKQAPPKYALFDEIIYADGDITDVDDLLDIYQGVIHSIEFRDKTFYYGLKGIKNTRSQTGSYPYAPYGDCSINLPHYSSDYEDIEEKEILGLSKDSAQAVNKVFDARIKELEKERAKTLKRFKK